MAVIEKKFLENTYIATYSVEKEDDGVRLDQFIQTYLNGFSRQSIKRKIDIGEITISKRNPPHRPSTKVHTNDLVTITTHNTTHEEEIWNGEPIKLTQEIPIIYEDDGLLVISKPPFMSTHPTGKHLFYCATVYFETRYKKTIHSIHRLDRETSGILLLGKDSQTSQKVSAAFENDKVSKCYFLIGHNIKKKKIPDEFSIALRLGSEDEDGPKRVFVSAYPEGSLKGKEALTHFKTIEYDDNYVLALAFPVTGRQHQIRVHAASANIPLLGDKLYHGGYDLFQRFKDLCATKDDHDLMQIPRHALHAISLKMNYNGNDKILIDKIPADLMSWLSTYKERSELDHLLKKIQNTILKYFN